MGKKAVLIGCNYPGTKAELKGCINDVNRMYNCLVDRYGFKPDNITVLIDTDSAFMQPTGVNIRRALKKLVGSAKSADYLFVHYSGHGTRLPAETGELDDTGFDECIVPTDMNLITDEDFKELVCQVPDGCTITIVSDSCHSGGLISGLKEQIGESTTQPQQKEHHFSLSGFLKQTVKETVKEKFESRGIQIPSSSHHHEQQRSENEYRVFEHDDYHHNWGYVQNKSLPLSTLIELLKEKTGKDDIDVGKIRPTLFDIFGDDASPKVKKFMKVILNRLRRGGKEGSESGGGLLSAVGGLALEFIKQKLEENDEEEYAKPAMDVEVESTKEVYAGSRKKTLPKNGILLSGCQSNQTSADASPAGKNADAYGAFSNAIQFILKETDGRVSNEDIVLKARGKLKKQGFTQRPGLYCSDAFVDAPFIC